MKNEKGFSNILLILIALLIIGGVFVAFRMNNETGPNRDVAVPKPVDSDYAGEVNTVPYETSQEYGIAVVYPNPSQTTAIPVKVSGSIEDPGKWQVFEGQAGVVKLYGDVNGQKTLLATEPLKLLNFDYGEGPFMFNLFVGTSVSVSELDSKQGSVVFEEENASGMGPVDRLEIPVTFK